MNIELREVTPQTRKHGDSWSKRPSPQQREMEIREPGRPGAINQSESAAQGSFVNLQENRTMSTQPTPQQRMIESFKRMGMSEESAQRAAAGRDNGPSNFAESIPASLRETLNKIDGIQPGTVVVHHVTESERKAIEARDADRAATAAKQTDMAESFERMGMSPAAAKIAARGR